jgi:glycine C-acetyltransferase/8-amino-7-oxononanoate synthase
VARPGLVGELRRNAAMLREALASAGLDTGASRTQIIPVVLGDPRRAMSVCERALALGVFAQAIRPPTVPVGGSRLRLTVMAGHRGDELRSAARMIAAAAAEVGAGAAASEPIRGLRPAA